MCDLALVREVKRVCSPRLPSVLVSLVLEFANDVNHKLKRECMRDLFTFARCAPAAASLWNLWDHVISSVARALKKTPRDQLTHTDVVLLRPLTGHIEVEPTRISCLFPFEGHEYLSLWEKTRLLERLRKNVLDNKSGAFHQWVRQKPLPGWY